MAYNKRTWATGNVVGAVDLNRMESGIEESYPGYEYKEEIVTLWEGSVTIEVEEGDTSPYYTEISYIKQITADKLRVTFNGVVYECNKEDVDEGNLYGGNGDFSNYPFTIFSAIEPSGSVYNELATEAGGTHTLKIEADNSTITTNKSFQQAVKSVGDSGYECTTSFEEVFSESGTTEVQKDTSVPSKATLSYTEFINADEIKVVFNDTEYICPKIKTSTYAVYGAYDSSFTDYPFAIGFSKSYGNSLQTKDPINFTVEVYTPVTTATVTPCFETAVKTVMGGGNGVKVVHISGNPTSGFTCDTSCDEMSAIIRNGGYLVAYANSTFFNLDSAPQSLVTGTSVAKATPTLRAVVDNNIVFSKVYITSEKVVKEIFTFNLSNCNISYSENAYPAEQTK